MCIKSCLVNPSNRFFKNVILFKDSLDNTAFYCRLVYWKPRLHVTPSVQYVLVLTEEKTALLYCIFIMPFCASENFHPIMNFSDPNQAVFRVFPNSPEKLQAIYIEDKHPFEELENFMKESANRFVIAAIKCNEVLIKD